MTTIERVLGVNPTKEQIEAEFKARELKLTSYEIIVERVNNGDQTYMVHGFQSSESRTPEEALMKYMIQTDAIEKKGADSERR